MLLAITVKGRSLMLRGSNRLNVQTAQLITRNIILFELTGDIVHRKEISTRCTFWSSETLSGPATEPVSED